MDRAYLSISAAKVATCKFNELYGQLALKLPFAVEPTQRAAWEYQLHHLAFLAAELPTAHFYLEFLIPRMGRRADLIVIVEGVVFVVEYKLGARQFDRSGRDQVYGYGLDLKHFHETSHNLPVVPMLVATEANGGMEQATSWDDDGLARPLCLAPDELAPAINHLARVWGGEPIIPEVWLAGRYRPTPTIVEAAQALYRGHAVEEISRSEAGAENLTRTADHIAMQLKRQSVSVRRQIIWDSWRRRSAEHWPHLGLIV